MVNGLVVDAFTQSFLDLTTNPTHLDEVHQGLRGFFHDARNRLSLIKIGLYVARRSGSVAQEALWSELDQSYQGLERFIDRVQTLCRPPDVEPYSANLGVWLGERRPVWTKWFEDHGRALLWKPPPIDVGGWFDPVSLVKGLDAFLYSRAARGESGRSASLGWSYTSSSIQVDYTEEGVSLAEPLEARECGSLSMALPLLARAMAAQQGTFSIESDKGLTIRMNWPIRTVPAT